MNNMIDDIGIVINNGPIKLFEIFIIVNKLKCSINGKVINMTKDDIDDFLRIIRYWKSEYKGSSEMDEVEYIITLYSNGKEETLKGKGDYPKNFDLFMEWIRNIYDRKI